MIPYGKGAGQTPAPSPSYLEDIRDDRIHQLSGSGIEPMFPLWCSAEETPGLARRLLEGGARAVLTCVADLLAEGA